MTSTSSLSRPRLSLGRRLSVKLAAGATTLALAVLSILFVATPAEAATTVRAQLSLSGVATASSPIGGSVVGIHPGDSVTVSAATLPTAGLDSLGLGSLVGGLLSSLAGYQVTADFSGLPGGAVNTVLSGATSKTFTFPTVGTYNFTWSAQNITLLGAVPINLDGNQLKAAGIELNAQNQYVGQIVVSNNPPAGGLTLQLPSISVSPKLPIVGQLPTIKLPGLTTPTIPVTLPATTSTPQTASTPPSTSTNLTGVPVPALVVPQGTGEVLGSTSDYQFTPLNLSGGSLGTFGSTATSFGNAAASTATGKAAPATATKPTDVTLADSRPASTSGLPVVLAVVSVLALVLVAGTYARLFLLGGGKEPAGS